MKILQVGFIGLGNMGAAICERLLTQGAELHVHDLDRAKVAALAAKGAKPHTSAKSVADAVTIVCTCLNSVNASRAVVLGDDGIALGAAIRCFIEMSTVGPKMVAEFAAALSSKGVSTLDAPVSGGAEGALRGTLTIMVAGAADAVAQALPVLSAISSNVVRIGDKPGEGQAMKLVNNLLSAANIASSFEAIALGEALGLSARKMIDVINISSGQNRMLEKRGDAIASRQFEVGGAIALLAKDISLAFDEARTAGLPVQALDALAGMAKVWNGAVDEGMAARNVPALITHIERKLGIAKYNR